MATTIKKKKPVAKHQTTMPIQPEKTKKDYSLLFIVISLVATALTFSNSISNDFTSNWDDNVYILNCDLIRDVSWSGVQKIFTTPYGANYHPLTTLTYAIQYKLHGLSPKPFHTLNLIFHLLNVLLVFILIKKMTQKAEIGFVVSLLYGLHPMHVESVSWISERKDLMFGFFYIASMIFYADYLKNNKKYLPLVLSFLLFAFSCLSKSMAVSLPAILVLMDFYFKRKVTSKAVLEKIPFFALSLVFGIVAIYAQKASGTIYSQLPFSWIERIFLVGYSISFYILKLFVPFNLCITHFYPDSNSSLPLQYWVSPLFIMVIAFAVYRTKVLKRELIFGLLFYLISISLVLQLIPIGQFVVAERYSYIPYLGLFFIAGKTWESINAGYSKKGRLITLVVAGFLLMLAVLSFQRNKVWKNGRTLFTDAVEKNPDQALVYTTRGNDYLAYKEYNKAVQDFTDAIRLMPNYADAWHNRGISLYNMKEYTGAIKDYTKGIELQPKNYNIYYSRGLAEYESGNDSAAIKDYDKVIELAGNYLEVYNNRGVSKGQLNYLEGSISDFDKAIEYDPKNPNGWFNRGNSKLLMQKIDEACKDYQKAAQLGSDGAREMIAKYCGDKK
jgi:protein O-mannosyl-transferase